MKIKSVTFSNILWNTDGEEINLPSEITINFDNINIDLSNNPNEIIENEGANILSNIYGWCVEGFNFKIN